MSKAFEKAVSVCLFAIISEKEKYYVFQEKRSIVFKR